jgi:hypothetical protein
MSEAALTDGHGIGAAARPPRPRAARKKPRVARTEAPAQSAEERALGPITAIAEALLGPVGGGWISEQRAHNRACLRRRTEEILRERNVALDFQPSPSVAIPLIAAAQDEGRAELIDLWARLVATAFDPAAQAHYRRAFVGIAGAMEPADALCLSKLDGAAIKSWRYRRESLAKAMAMPRDRVDLALHNLAGLGLIDLAKLDGTDFQPFVTALGREFLAALHRPPHRP